ncbi:ArsR/SmtB family transcription factor [Prauserella muralis]|uniref:Transcriptional regulator n=1 Tax=Prauserella muralis TaxID=588067 RepID=A0A2V4BAW0_9PSEU|nr:helix-turn-helix domain-containing protein [Prauserella muralis]PXY32286.1 transcriptional regulator [Prauserella muralis]TWE24038.1 ArsR family transcriptional regulator [Prauserella muralis]
MGRVSAPTSSTYRQPDRSEIRIETVLHALADPVRLDMVRQLARCEGELACGGFDVSVSKSTLTHHLRTLREAGVIGSRPMGTTRQNWLRRKDLDALFPGLLDGILAAPR